MTFNVWFSLCINISTICCYKDHSTAVSLQFTKRIVIQETRLIILCLFHKPIYEKIVLNLPVLLRDAHSASAVLLS